MKHPLHIFLLFFSLFFIAVSMPSVSYAGCKPKPPAGKCGCCGGKGKVIDACKIFCTCVSDKEMGVPDDPLTTLGHITDEFNKQRNWMTQLFFRDPKAGDAPGLLAAMQLMSNQLAAVGMQQVQVIGTFFDAKHQLETQRLFQTLTAKAHKDYHPSESLCEMGTITRSLSGSSRNSDLTLAGLSQRIVDRQLLAKDHIGNKGVESDQAVRLKQFVQDYCNKEDNSGHLDYLCKLGSAKVENHNKDVNYTTMIDSALTIDLDFTSKGTDATDDEKALFALSSNLYSHTLLPFVSATKFMTDDEKEPNYSGALKDYQDARALMAKRNVATNSLAAITALKAKGDAEAQPFIYSVIKEMSPKTGDGVLSAEDIEKLIGENPSYYAQMEILTKKLYQNPEFFSDLYDKPANVMRKDVALQAISLMQKRDLYRSYLRSEMTLAVMLETALIEEQNRIENIIGPESN